MYKYGSIAGGDNLADNDVVTMARDPRSHQLFLPDSLAERVGDIPRLKREKRFSYRIGDMLARYCALCDGYEAAIYERFTPADIATLRLILSDAEPPIDQIEHFVTRSLLSADLPDREYQQSLFERLSALSLAEQIALLEILTHPDRP